MGWKSMSSASCAATFLIALKSFRACLRNLWLRCKRQHSKPSRLPAHSVRPMLRALNHRPSLALCLPFITLLLVRLWSANGRVSAFVEPCLPSHDNLVCFRVTGCERAVPSFFPLYPLSSFAVLSIQKVFL